MPVRLRGAVVYLPKSSRRTGRLVFELLVFLNTRTVVVCWVKMIHLIHYNVILSAAHGFF